MDGRLGMGTIALAGLLSSPMNGHAATWAQGQRHAKTAAPDALTNWDASRLASLVKKGTPVVFEDSGQ